MFRKLLTLEETQETIRKNVSPCPLGIEQVLLLEAYGRVLAEDAIAGLDVPSFGRATVDGYAVRSSDTFGAEENKPRHLRFCGSIKAGQMPKVEVNKGAAVEIVTGAPMPKGADAVVMAEHTNRRMGFVDVFCAVAKSENMMKAGADIKKGEIALKCGQLLGSKEIGVLAAVGNATARVYKVPQVAVLSTGAEITEPGAEILPGRIYDINAFSLTAAVLEAGGKPMCLGIFQDDLGELQTALRRAISLADAVVTSGGVSVGPKDVMPKALSSLGEPGVIVNGIAIKPGKPTVVAVIGGKPVFSLPGHPASALLTFHLLARPVIRAMGGHKAYESLRVKALAGSKMFSAKGRRTFIMVKLVRDKSAVLTAKPVASGLSGAITTLSNADGYVEIPEAQQFIESGDEVTVHLLNNSMCEMV